MADGESRIPQYNPLNSRIPVLSRKYKSVLRKVKEKKANIERLQADKIALTKDLVVLKQQFKDKDTRRESAGTERRAPQPSSCDQIDTECWLQ